MQPILPAEQKLQQLAHPWMDQQQQEALALYISFEAQQQTRTDKPLTAPSQAYWQKASRNFTYTPLGLNSGPFFISI
jgi:hypothetical protein